MSVSKISSALALATCIALSSPALANTAPTISGTPPSTAQQGGAYSFTATTGDRDGDRVRCSLYGGPAWLSLDRNTCRASGAVPVSVAAGTVYANLWITASDGRRSARLGPFSITVTASAAGTLTLTGTPPTATTAGTAYSFTPTLTNTTGRTATYSVTNKPSWLSLSIATGALTGTATASQVASYTNIVITASNGSTQASLAPFTLTVKAAASPSVPPATSPGTGSATLSWIPPTTTTGGGALGNLAGYRVYYGSSATDLSQSVSLTNPGLTSYVVSGLPAGVWYFAMTAYTTLGDESVQSNVGSKAVN